jgi:hypothetical protein
MFKHLEPTGSRLVTYELSADDFELFEGDTVAPGSEIGTDIRSGSAVWLEGWGRVAAAFYNPMNDSYRVMIYQMAKTLPTESSIQEETLISA